MRCVCERGWGCGVRGVGGWGGGGSLMYGFIS